MVLVPILLPVLLARPLDHPRPVLLAVHAPAPLVHGAVQLRPPLRGGAGGGGRDLGRGRQLGLAHGHGLAQTDVLSELLVDGHSQLESFIRNSHRQALTQMEPFIIIIFSSDFYSFYWVINDQFDKTTTTCIIIEKCSKQLLDRKFYHVKMLCDKKWKLSEMHNNGPL